MPPKAKFTKEQITQAALEIVRAEGWDSLTARALGKQLGSSARPIFTLFRNMQEVQQSVTEQIKAIYKGYVEQGLSETPAFKGVGTQYIRFAMEEPKLFQTLFMNGRPEPPGIDTILPLIDESYDQILASILQGYGLSEPDAEILYRHLWIYTHGIASLCAAKMCRFTGPEISGMMTEVFISLLRQRKEGKKHD